MKRNDSSDSFEHGLFHCSPPLGIPLGAIRRKLWILNTKLQSLPAKIESMYRQSGEGVSAEGFKRCMHDGSGLAQERLNGRSVLGCWSAKWNRAKTPGTGGSSRTSRSRCDEQSLGFTQRCL